jgi:activator of HSP90 ATPase
MNNGARDFSATQPLALLSRRQAVSGAALALGSILSAHRASAAQQPAMRQVPATDANAERTSLHQEIEFAVKPARMYEVLLSSKEFAAFTGMPAEIDPRVGGALSMFGGMVLGRNVELIPNQRIVQAWRRATWEPGVYSMVKFELKGKGTGVTVVLDHTGFPKGDYEHLYSGWGERYWDPLRKYLA